MIQTTRRSITVLVHSTSRTGSGLQLSAPRDSGKDQLPVRQPGASLTALSDALSHYRFLDVPIVDIATIYNAKNTIRGFQCTKLRQRGGNANVYVPTAP